MNRSNITRWCATLLILGFALHSQGANFDAWRYRSKIRFTGYTGNNTLTNFPARVELGPDTISNFRYGDFLSGANHDLRFAAADKTTELDYEIEQWNTNGSSTVWVRVPELGDTNTFLYAYWGRTGQEAPACTTNGSVWGDTHLGAWHLNGNEQDGSSRDNHGVNYGTTTAEGIAGKGREFAGTAYIDLPENLRNLGATNAFAITFWFKSASASSPMQCLMEDGTSYSGDSIYLFANAGADQILAHLRNDSGNAVQLDTINVSDIGTNWHAVAHVYDGATIRTYFDGEEAWNANISGDINSGNTHLQLGRRPGGSFFFQGVMDEVRIERISRPVDWIRACWKNQGANETFQTYGAAELQSGGPEIQNRTPVVLNATTAVLNGSLVSTGTSATAVSVYWGPADGGATTSGLWQATNTWAAGVWDAGDTPSLTVSNLTSDLFHYYRYAAGNASGDDGADSSESFLAGEVWVSGDTAYEAGEIPGTFTFQRAASATGEASVVNFTIGGTATAGDDYVAITQNTITIPAGETTATLTVAPIYDLFDEADETVELSLLPGLYALGAGSDAVVTIMDANVPAATNWSVISTSSNWHDSASWSLGSVPITGEDVVVTNDLLLQQSSVLLQSFTLQAGTLTFTNWSTRLRAVEVDLQNGELTLPPAFPENQMSNRVWIACSNLTVAADVTINADGRGFADGNGPGITSGTYGGSYGGRGAGEGGWVNRPDSYGSVSAPTDPGSGGRSFVNSGAGGGAIRIDADGRVTVYGTLTADGEDGPITHSSGGSGGAVLVNCRTFAGSSEGLISAVGGSGKNRGGGAGGGRIAVRYAPAAQADMASVNPGVRFDASHATSGDWVDYAEDGTLYFPDTLLLSEQMTAQWQGGNIHVDGFTSWSLPGLEISGSFGLPEVTNLSVSGNFTLHSGGKLSLYSAPTNDVLTPYGMVMTVGEDLSISNNARLVLTSHSNNGSIPRITCDQLYVATGAVINADHRGYGPLGESDYTGPGGGTPGTYGEGASHGGRGSTGNGNWLRPVGPYGDAMMPLTPGSAGGSAAAGGWGGGAIAISAAGSATIYGSLTADGGDSETHGGTGSGGSILIECDTFYGSPAGLLRARGGQHVQNSGGGGGGGRIAVLYNKTAQAALAEPNPGVQFSVAPSYTGIWPHLAEPGTLYLPDADTFFLSEQMSSQWQNIRLIIPGFTDWELSSLLIDGHFSIDGLQTIHVTGDMTVSPGAVLTLAAHPTNVVDPEFGFLLQVDGTLEVLENAEVVLTCDHDTGAMPYIECESFHLHADSMITADYRGFEMGVGPGHGSGRAGGGYGGAGSRGADGAANAGPTNGVAHAPILPGSGAGTYASGGGRGGGVLRIGTRGSMTIDGTLRANGMDRLSTHAGAGAGGGILLSAGSFSGTGILSADGGNSSHNGGAGGGGRICVWTPYQTPEYLRELATREDPPGGTELFDPAAIWPELTVSVAAGTGGTNPEEAEDGTIFFGRLVQGSLFILR